MPFTVALLPGHHLAEEWKRKESFLCAERCVCVTRCPRIILTQRRAGKCFWVFFFFLSSPCGAPPAQVGPVEWGACARAGRGRAGRSASHRPQPLSPPCCLEPAAQSARQPAMTGAPVLALLLLGQLLTAPSAQVSASPRVPTGPGIGLYVERHYLGQLEPPGPNPEFRCGGPSRTSMAASSPPRSGERVLVMQLSLLDIRTRGP